MSNLEQEIPSFQKCVDLLAALEIPEKMELQITTLSTVSSENL